MQKEFFQLIFSQVRWHATWHGGTHLNAICCACVSRWSQIFDPSYGMFVYDDENRQYWFNRSSLENEREFELIGVILGAAIYNGAAVAQRSYLCCQHHKTRHLQLHARREHPSLLMRLRCSRRVSGVILDARFPHVVYKKLMNEPVR